MYVTVKRHGEVFDEAVRINYSRSETVASIDEIENDIARECLRFLEIEPPIYVSTVGDLPASTGLGGSSAFAVGLLNALHAFRGDRVSAGQLAEEACHIEIEVLGQPIGKQDQYAAAFGGLNLFTFKPNGAVTVEPHRVKQTTLGQIFERMMLMWTGHQRDTRDVLGEQRLNTSSKRDELRRMRDHAHELQDLIARDSFMPGDLGRVLDETWRIKRSLASTITNPQIDDWYQRAMDAGALGGKVLGAGGGGFLLLIVEPDRRLAVRSALSELVEVPAWYEVHGSRVLSTSPH
jgi:D-glycero-alpha-D-manno-heptose-7-phosphate kinase